MLPLVVRFDIFGQCTRDPNGALLGCVDLRTAGFLRSAVPSYWLWQSQQDLQLSNRPLTDSCNGCNGYPLDSLSLSALLILLVRRWFKWIVTTMIDWAEEGTFHTGVCFSRIVTPTFLNFP